jgi:hypothetical protein
MFGVQEVRWDKAGTIRAGDYTLFYGKGNDNHQLGTGFFVHQNLYSPNIIRIMKSRRLRWAGHVAHMGEGEVRTRFWWRNLREEDHLDDPGVDGRVI